LGDRRICTEERHESPKMDSPTSTNTSDFEDALRARLAAWLNPCEQPAEELPSIPDYLWENAEKVEFPTTLTAERRAAARRVALSMGLYPRSDGPKTRRYMTVFAPHSPEYVPMQAPKDLARGAKASNSTTKKHRADEAGKKEDGCLSCNGNDGRSPHGAGASGSQEQATPDLGEPVEVDQTTQLAIECKLIQWQKPDAGYCAPKVREVCPIVPPHVFNV
jgi:hypothetical protein